MAKLERQQDFNSDFSPIVGDVENEKGDQYYNAASYRPIKNSEVFKDNKKIALALYNQPKFDTITVKNKPQSECKGDTEFKLAKFQLNESGYIAKLESGSQIITITGKNAYIIIPDFMNSDKKGDEDKRVNINNGIIGYYDDNPKINSDVKFNVMVVLDTATDVNNFFEVNGDTPWLTRKALSKILNAAKKRGASAGYHISSEQQGYTEFVVNESTFTVSVNRKSAIDYYQGKTYHPSWVNSLVKNLPGL